MKTIDYQYFTFFIFILLLFISSCGVYTELPSKKFSSILNDKKEKLNSDLNFEGVYHFIRKESYNHPTDYKDGYPTRYVDTPYVDQPIFFFNNGLMAYCEALSLDSVVFNQGMLKYSTKKDDYLTDWGVYEVIQDKISAIIYLRFSGSGFKSIHQLQFYFEGVLKNKDTIQQWHLVPPYPSIVDSPQNKRDIEYLKIPKDLYFKSVPIKTLINPDSAWINEFRGLREADLKGGKKRRKTQK